MQLDLTLPVEYRETATKADVGGRTSGYLAL